MQKTITHEYSLSAPPKRAGDQMSPGNGAQKGIWMRQNQGLPEAIDE
jgi:hypothetical protein